MSKQKFYSFIVRFIRRFYWIILLAGILLIFFSWPRMAFLFKNISTDPADLLPPEHPSVATLLEIREKVNAPRRTSVVLESENPENTKKLLNDLAKDLEALPLVGEIWITKPGYDFLDKNKFLFMELDDLQEIRDRIDRKIQQEKLGGFYISFEDEESDSELNFSDLEEKYRSKYGEVPDEPYYVSPNGLIYGMVIIAKENQMDLAQEQVFQRSIEDAVQNYPIKKYDPSMKTYISGSGRLQEYRILIRDLKVAGMISGVVLFLPLLIRFRRPHWVLLIFLPLLIGVPSGIALASIWIPRLNITTSFLFAILGGLGVETGIHIFSRYYEKRKSGLTQQEGIHDIFEKLIPPVFTAVAALATTFLLMAFSDFKGFSEFGIISGIGLWTIFILYFTFFPALLVFAEKIHLLKFKGEFTEIGGAFAFSPNFSKICLSIFFAFTAYCLITIPSFSFEYNTKAVRADRPDDREALRKQRATGGKRVNAPAMLLVKSEAEAEALKDLIDKKIEANPDGILDYSSSIFSLVPEQQPEKLGILKEIQEMLSDDSIRLVGKEDRDELERFKFEITRPESFQLKDIPEDITEVFTTEGSEHLFLIFPQPQLEMDDARNAMEFREAIDGISTSFGTYHPSSSAIIFGDVVQTLLKDAKIILGLALLSVTFFVYLDFKNIKRTLVVMASIVTGVLWALGVLFLLGDKLNLYNIVMIPAVMGMSVDNAIHVYHRYLELGKGSLGKVLGTTGIAAVLASMTNAAGFVGLTFSFHGGLQSMGKLAVIGVVTCLLSTLLFMPLLLNWREKRVIS